MSEEKTTTELDWVLVWKHQGCTTQLPTPPPLPKKKSWAKTLWLRSLALYLLQKSFTSLL